PHPLGQVLLGEFERPRQEVLRGESPALLPAPDPVGHALDPLVLLRAGEPGGNGHDEHALLAEGRDRAAAARAPAHLDRPETGDLPGRRGAPVHGLTVTDLT